MKKFALRAMCLLAALCMVKPVVGAQKDVTLSDLINASKDLPVSYHIDHLCIKVLEDTLSDFKVEENLYEKGHNTKDVKALANEGILAMRGAKSLLIGLIHGLNKEKNKLESLEQDHQRFTKNLEEAESKLTTARELYKKKCEECQKTQQQFTALADQVASTARERVEPARKGANSSGVYFKGFTVVSSLLLFAYLLYSSQLFPTIAR
jgi:hypothetical protein